MDYRLELLHDSSFEEMINTICQKLLGMGIISFSPGADGGRDGKFTGIAEKYPSAVSPWSGQFIIQAKHTANPIASCSDREFIAIVNHEIPKIIKMKTAGLLDNYLIFTNRKYTGVVGEEILNNIKKETGLKNVVILGKEVINNTYLNSYKDIVRQYELDKHHIAFDFSDTEIAYIIQLFKGQLQSIESQLAREVERIKYDFDKITMDEKNIKNQMGNSYYENEILGRSLMDFEKIRHFLDNPINDSAKEQYYDIAAELSQIITLKRDNFASFEEIFVFIYKTINDGNTLLVGAKRHVMTLLHFMYFECLVGQK